VISNNNARTKIVVARTDTCGAPWSKPKKVSKGFLDNDDRDDDDDREDDGTPALVNQGAAVAVDPNTGHVYVAWRQISPPAIYIVKSTNEGRSFSKPVLVTEFDPCDQGASAFSFRTTAFPTMAVDGNGRVHIAIAERVGPGPAQVGQRDSRIVLYTSPDGTRWTGNGTTRTIVDQIPVLAHPFTQVVYNPGRGHQFQPTIAIAGAKIIHRIL